MSGGRVMRRLTTIVAADVEGYSRLTASDEEGTLAALRSHRDDLIDPKIAEYRGRIANTAGDSVLVEFPSVVEALRCAMEIQRAMHERNGDIPAERRIAFRMGINVGDVIEQDGDLLGDGVNVAARLEQLAAAGGICVSRSARDQVRDRLDVSFEDLGEITVKNIARPVRVFRLLLDKDASMQSPTLGVAPDSRHSDKPSIAVLAFDNMSDDPDQEYFADGIAEDVITALSKFREFMVIARNSSFTYKGRAVDMKRIARELGVQYVLEGSVRKAANKVRITAQLIDAPTGRHVWAERFDRGLDDIFAVQDEITNSIIGAFAPGVLSAEVQRVRDKRVANLGAWDRIMRAHWHIRQFTQADLIASIDVLEELLVSEPNNAIALGDLAVALHFGLVFGWIDAPEEALTRIGDAARRAVAADDHDSSAHTALAIYELFSGRHAEAMRRLERATEINPNSNFARGYMGVVQAFGGECDNAIDNLQAAIRLSPRDTLIVVWCTASGWAYLSADQFDEAAASARQAIDWNPGFMDAHGILAAASGHLGRLDDARMALDDFVSKMPGLSLNDPRLLRPFRRPSDRDRFLTGLRLAGLQQD